MKSVFLNIIAAFLIGSSLLYATDQDTSIAKYSKVLSVGAGAGMGLLGVTWDANLLYQSENNLIAIRYLTSREARFEIAFAGNPGFSRPLESTWEIDALVGKKVADRSLTASIMGGLSVIGGTLRGKFLSPPDLLSSYNEYQHLDQTVVGVPIEGRLAFTPIENFDLGVSAILNLNSKRTLKGFYLSFRLLCPLLSFAG